MIGLIACWRASHADRVYRHIDYWRWPGRAGNEPYAQPEGLRKYCARAAPNCRTLADGTMGWPSIPVSQLVGQAPGFPFPHSDPDGFATSDEIVKYLTAYADFVGASVRCGVAVRALRRRESSFGFVRRTV
jgi:hypothetical protein